MKLSLRVLGICWIMCLATGLHGEPGAAPGLAEVEAAVVKVEEYEHGKPTDSLRRVEELVRRTRGHAVPREHLERQLAKLLDSQKVSFEGKQFVCDTLVTISSEISLPALEKLLRSKEMTAAACRAMSHMDTRAVDKALRAALTHLRGDALVSVVDLLGERRDAASDVSLEPLTGSSDPRVARAAVAALGKIATVNARATLKFLRSSGSKVVRWDASHAYLQSGQELARRGQRDAALRVFRDLVATTKVRERAVRRGASLGVKELEDGWVTIFNGRDLEGWEGKEEFFQVRDGAIAAGSLERPIPHNEFLCTTREYSDFELRMQVKIVGEGENAGIQFRSKRVPSSTEVSGYQADVGKGVWGSLYDESRRNEMLVWANKGALARVLRPNGWNDYLIYCVGKSIQLSINGVRVVDYTEPDDAIARRGILGLQIHSGAPSVASYRHIRIREINNRQ